MRLLAVLNVLSSTPARAKRLAPCPDGPLTHFASPRGEKCRLAVAGTWRRALRAAEREWRVTLWATDICGRRLCRSSEEITRIAILLTPRRTTAGARRAFHGTFDTGC